MQRIETQSTKIIATIGPACSSPENLLRLVEAGVDLFRLNFSHGSHAEYAEVIDNITAINEKHNVYIGILADLQGPKIRIGKIENDTVQVAAGDKITFTTKSHHGNKEKVQIVYDEFPSDVNVGERILLDDGKLEFKVLSTNKVDEVKLQVIYGGPLSSNKGVNLPDSILSVPSLTEKDKEDLDFILTKPINWIALSFVRTSQDMKDLQKLIDAKNHDAKTIAKIEKPQAVKNIKKIIKFSNAIMLARGDLGVEVPMEQLPTIQKSIINQCIQRARPVIVATQMMDSMITNPSPTRAEVTDVANAVLDGCDAVMLSAETSVGRHPVKVVQAMKKIIDEAEKSYSEFNRRPKPSPKSNTFLSDVMCLSSARVADEIGAKGIAGLTVSGYTAFKVSSWRPDCKIFIFSHEKHILGTLNLVWGVRGFHYDKFTTTDGTIKDIANILLENGKVEIGDVIINTGSMPIDKRFRTNFMKVTTIE